MSWEALKYIDYGRVTEGGLHLCNYEDVIIHAEMGLISDVGFHFVVLLCITPHLCAVSKPSKSSGSLCWSLVYSFFVLLSLEPYKEWIDTHLSKEKSVHKLIKQAWIESLCEFVF